MTIDFNRSPYYDDFDEAKKFLRILFRPGVAVQTRELTQLQTILQNQITRFGNHIFNEGSMVIPGQVSFDTDVGYVKLENLNSGSQQISTFLSEFEGTTVTGSISGLTALVLKAIASENGDPHTLLVKYTNSGTSTSAKSFTDAEEISSNAITPRTATLAPTAATGKGSVASIGAGIYYVYGNFVLVDEQTLVLDKYDTAPSYRVGLQVTETLVAPEDDQSLNDNAQGSFNYAAPGAHRYKISLTLAKLAVDSVLDQSFVELLRIKAGAIQFKVTQTDYSQLEKTLARRTYDESGNYTVRPFNIEVREHRNNNRGAWAGSKAYLVGDIITNAGNYYVAKNSGTSGTSAPTHTSGDSVVPDGTVTWTFTVSPAFNRGIYDAEDTVTPGDESKLAIGLEPGKAYVQGYEVEKVATEYVSVPKSRSINRANDVTVSATVGNYVTIKNVTSIPENVTSFPSIDLYDRLTATGGSASGSKIGSARIRGIESNGDGTYKLFLFNVAMNAGKTFERNVKQFFYNNSSIFDFTADIAPALTQLSGSITAAGSTSVTGTGTKFTSQLTIGDYISVNGSVRRVTAIATDIALTVDTALTATAQVYYLETTAYVEPQNSGLIFPMVQTAIRKVRSSDDTTVGTTYAITRNLGTQTTDGSGSFSVNLTVLGESFASTALTNNYLVVKNTDGSIATPAIALNVGSTSATFTGLSAATAYTVVATINKSGNAAKEKTKTLVSNVTKDFTTSATATTQTLMLGKADVFSVVSIKMATAFGAYSDTGAIDITDRYTVDNGQRLTHYDIGRLTLKSGQPGPTGSIRVTFSYLNHSAGDYFSVDSYTGSVQYGDIVYLLRDAFDFRPRIDDTGVDFTSAGSSLTSMPKRGIDVQADYSYYLARKDKICLNLDGKFFAINGIPSVNPDEPIDPNLGMVLHKISLSPYTFDTTTNSVIVESLDNKRYTMQDIGRLEKRIENVEYYTSLSLLEHETKMTTILDDNGLDRYKNGFIVDSFEGHGVGNSNSPDYVCSVDMQKKELRPFYAMKNVNLIEENTSDALRAADGYQLTGALITLPYTNQALVDQPYASRTENVNPFAIFTFIGTIGLNPSSDEWFEVNRRPDIIINREGNFNTIATLAEKSGVLGTVWNAWQTQWTGSSVTTVGSAVYNPHGSAYTSGDSTAANAAAGILFSQYRPNTMARTITVATNATVVGQARTGVRTSVVAKVDTQTIEDKVLSTAVIPYIRSRNVLFLARGLKPNTRFYPMFDNADIGPYITPATKISIDPITGFGSDFDYETNVGGIASETARRINGNVDSALNKGDVITGQTSGAKAVVVYREVTAAGAKSIYVVNVSGTFQNSEEIRGSISSARGKINATVTATSQGDALTSNFNGTVVGLFNIPNTDALRFRTGTREFKLTDSSTNGLDFTSQGRVQYKAQGLLETKQATILATRNAEIVQEVVNQTQTIVQTSSTVIGDTGWWDPLAQSFLVQQKGGTFITKIDAYFATKDTGIPVQMEIREMVNGYPGKYVLPLSRVIKNPDEVFTSTDASVKTTFTFESPVYLADATEYCIVLMSDSNNYNVWISQLGEKNVGTDRFISEQPYAGVLFKSQNASTWTADQMQDLKFTIYRAKFATGTQGTVTFTNDVLPIVLLDDNPFQTTNGSNKIRVRHTNHGMIDGSTVVISGVPTGTYNNIPSTELNAPHIISDSDFDSYVITSTTNANASGIIGGGSVYASEDARFDTLNPIIENRVFDDTTLTVDTRATTLGYTADGSNVPLTANDKTNMSAPKVIASAINETVSSLNGAKSLRLNSYLYSDNDSVSPVIDTHRLSVIAVNNRITTPSLALNVSPIDSRTLVSASALVAIDGTNERLTTSDTGVKALFASVAVGKYLTISGASNSVNNGTFLVTAVAADGSYITLNTNLTTETPSSLTVISNEKYVDEIAPVSSSGQSKYVTNMIQLANSSTYFKVMFAYNKPQDADIKVYYKTIPVGSTSSESSINYTLVNSVGSLKPSNDTSTFVDAEYSVSSLPAFNAIQIKIVMTSAQTTSVPRIKDFRVIACA